MTNQEYKKAMIAWVKEIVAWQLRNPDKDWATELFGATSSSESESGDRPITPPIKP